jgi:hypothetical protein
MQTVLTFLRDITAKEIFDSFIVCGIHHEFAQGKSEISDKLRACYSTPNIAAWQDIAQHLRIQMYHAHCSFSNCLSTQRALMTLLSTTFAWRLDQEKQQGDRLVATIEKNTSLQCNEYVAYAIGILGHKGYGGHALLLLQYKQDGELVYRIIQSYMNHYTMDMTLPMNHTKLLDWILKLSQFTVRGLWDDRKDELAYQLFRTCDNNRGVMFDNDLEIQFFCAKCDVDRFIAWKSKWPALQDGIQHFTRTTCLTDDEYEKKLVGQFEPLISHYYYQ